MGVLKRHILLDQDEQVRQHPQAGGQVQQEEGWTPTNEQIDQALNGKNPPHAIPAVPGRSGSSEVYVSRNYRPHEHVVKGTTWCSICGDIGPATLLKSGPEVSKEELERAERWDRDMEMASSTPRVDNRTIARRTLEGFPELREEAMGLCEEVEETTEGLHGKNCRLGGIAGKNRVLQN